MRLMDRNKRTVHLTSREHIDGVEFYAQPVAYRVNFRTAKALASMISPGESVSSNLVLIVNHEDGAAFREFDKVFVFASVPETYDAAATGADFIVESSTPGLNTTEVRLKRVQT